MVAKNKVIKTICEKMKHMLNCVNNEIKESIYVKWVKKNIGLICLCAFISAFICILTYPGIMYTDSYARTNMTTDLKLSLEAFLFGHSEMNAFSAWITIIPSFFISNVFILHTGIIVSPYSTISQKRFARAFSALPVMLTVSLCLFKILSFSFDIP